MNAARLAGALLVVLAGALVGLPLMDWFSATTPTGPVSASGVAVVDALWLVPPLALVLAWSGAALLAAGPGRRAQVGSWAGPAALVAALLMLGIGLWASAGATVTLSARGDGIDGAVAVAVAREAPASLTPALALIAVAVAIGVSVVSWRP